jgi:RND superfamily putative drug exporter
VTETTDTSYPAADGAAPTKKRHWRWILPTVLLLLWLGVAGPFGSYAGKLSEVQVNDQLQFLPESAESTVVAKLQGEFAEDESIPAVVVFEAESGSLTPAQLGQIQDLSQQLAKVPGVTATGSGAVPSEDGEAAVAFLPVDGTDGEKTAAAVEEIRAEVEANPIDGVTVYVGGPAGFLSDLTEAFGGIDGLLLLVTLGVVLVILLVVYRSPVLPFFVLLSSVLALGVASAVIYGLAANDIITLNGQAQGILSILVIGAATDYALLLVARYREELRRHESKYDAMGTAWRGVVEPILASGGTVILGVLVLLLSDLKANQGLGPVAAIGIVFAMLAGLTFLPAILVLLGRGAFWPFRPKFGSEGHEASGLWAGVARFVGRRFRAVWITVAVVLVGLAAFLPQFKADGVPSSEFFTTEVESTRTQQALERHFPAGSGSETVVITGQDTLAEVTRVLQDNDGVARAVPLTEGPQTGPPGTGAPQVIDGQVLLNVTLTDASDSLAAEETVAQLRSELDAVSPDAVIGGPTAAQFDTVATAKQDLRKIIPIVLIVILLVLMLLLRSVVGPIMLIGTVVLSFAATLGLGAIVFNQVLDLPGADPSVPLFAFVFLVALGIDYNIFLMTRTREEAITRGTWRGMLTALAVTGGVITSAGLVLAATFSALAILPLLFLFQIAFLVSVGVLIDTFIVRSLLVPGLILEIGPTSWWPSRLAREEGYHRKGHSAFTPPQEDDAAHPEAEAAATTGKPDGAAT